MLKWPAVSVISLILFTKDLFLNRTGINLLSQPRILDKIDVKFECECCKDKVQEALVAIGKTALSQIIEEDKQAEVGCQFCNSKYMYNEEELLNILKDM